MAVNIGPKIGIDGEKEYRKSINDLITQQKTFSSEMKNLESTFTKETTAMEKNRKKAELLTRQVKNQEEQVDKLEYGLKKAKEKFGENAAETQKWQQAVNNAKTELNRLRTELDNIPGKLGSMGQSLVESGNKMQETGRKLTDNITTPLMNIGTKSIDAFKEVKEGMDAIITKTGATGTSLDSLEQSMRNIATSIPTDFATAGEAIGEVNTRFGLTGEALEKLSTQFIKFAKLNKTDVSSSVDATDKILKAFGEDADEAGNLLDAMNQVGQDTGISMNTLQSSLVTNAAALHSMGMDSKDAAFFLGQVETSGANVQDVMTGLKKATANASKQGKTLNDVLSEFDTTMRSSKSDQEKLTAAINIFGSKAGPAIYNAYKSGSLSFQNLASDAKKYMGSVEDTFNATQTPMDKMTVILNKVKDSGAKLGASVLRVLSPAIDGLATVASDVCSAFNRMPESAQNVLVVGGLVAMGIGPAITLVGKLKTGIGSAMLALEGLGTGTATLSSLAGPIAIGIGAIAGITAALITAIDYFSEVDPEIERINNELSTATDALNESTKTLTETLDEAQKNIDEIGHKDKAAQPLVDELYKLESQSNKTAAEQARMKTIVAELNEMYPNLALSIDKSTGALSKSKEEVKGFIEASKQLELSKAYAEGAAKAISAIADANVKQIELQQKLEEAEAARAKYLEEHGDSVGFFETLGTGDPWTPFNQSIAEAKEALEQNNAEVERGERLYSEYTKKSEEAAAAADKLTKSTEKNTKAQKSNTKAEDDNIKKFAKIISGTSDAADETEEYTEEVEENTAAVKKQGSATIEAVKKIVEANKNEVKAWGDSYKAAKSSIESKTGLFKEWKVEITKTASDILANLKQQNADLQAYTQNLAEIEKAALESGNVNASEFVKYLHQVGIDGAAEVAAIAEDLRNGGTTMYEIMDEWGNNNALSTNIAKTAADAQVVIERDMFGLVKVGNDKLKELGGAAVADVVTKGLTGLAGKITTAYTNAQNAALKSTDTWVGRIQETIDKKKISANLHALNVKTASQEAVPRIEKYASGGTANLASVAVKSAATVARTSLTNYMYGIGGVVTSVAWQSAASSAWNLIYNFFANNPISVAIKTIVSGLTGKGYATGGIVTKEHVARVAEGNKPEAIIPLAPESRARAMTLYQQVGTILRADSVGRQSASVPLPTSNGFDLDALYSAVAAGAAEGLENANVKIYWDGREAGRIMRNMGVQFA